MLSATHATVSRQVQQHDARRGQLFETRRQESEQLAYCWFVQEIFVRIFSLVDPGGILCPWMKLNKNKMQFKKVKYKYLIPRK